MLRTLSAAVVAVSLIAGPVLAQSTAPAATITTTQPAAKHHVKHVRHVMHVRHVKQAKHVKHVRVVKHVSHAKQVKRPIVNKTAG
jgi:Ni/Co efflux regulator RcnB